LGVRNPTQNSNRYYLRNGRSYGVQIWPEHSKGTSKQNPIKNFGEKEAWAYPGTAHFWVPPVIAGTGKTTNFKFCTHIHSTNRKKNPLKISEKVAMSVAGTPGIFLERSYMGRIARSSLR